MYSKLLGCINQTSATYNRMKILKLLALISTVFGLAHTGNATNLVANGNFETGNLSSWAIAAVPCSIDSVPGQILSGLHSARIDIDPGTSASGTLSQSFPTVVNTYYVVRSTIAEHNTGGSVTITGSGNVNLASAYRSGAYLFKANSASTKISFSMQYGTVGTSFLVVDNVVVQLAAYSQPGHYSVTETLASAIPGVALTQIATRTGSARIDALGRMYFAWPTWPYSGMAVGSGEGAFELGVIGNDNMAAVGYSVPALSTVVGSGMGHQISIHFPISSAYSAPFVTTSLGTKYYTLTQIP